MNVAEAIGPAGVALRTWVGQSCPAHATSSGKVLLAALSDSDLRKRVATRLDSFTDVTVTSRADLEAELRTVRERGWASVREELEVGHREADRRGGREHQQAIGPGRPLNSPRFGCVQECSPQPDAPESRTKLARRELRRCT